jgi:hypothetical protein
MSGQIPVLQRIAVYAAKVRGHALGNWRTGDGFATASCIHCGHEITVYCAAMQPEMDGAALASECQAAVHPVAA